MKVNSATTQAVPSRDAKDVAGATGAKRAEKSAAAAAPQKNTAVDTASVKSEISPKAKEFLQAKEVAAKAPDVREDRIAELKRQIASGSYQVNAQAIADKMVDEHVSSGIG